MSKRISLKDIANRVGVSTALVDRFLPGVDASYIVLDNFRASYEAVNH